MHKCINKSPANVYHLEQMVDNFFPYSQKQLGFEQPCSIVFQSDKDNSQKMLGKTAHYDPATSEIVLYIDGRHPKDILRSLSHELVHHAQNCRGDFEGCDHPGWHSACVKDTEPGYAQRDPHMRSMEREAYTKGNLIFRDFEDLIKTGKINIEIDFSESGEPKMSLKEWKNDQINTKLMKKWGLLKEGTAAESENMSGRKSKEITDIETGEGLEESEITEDTEALETERYAEDEGADHKREGRLETHLKAIEHHLHNLRDDMSFDEEHERRDEPGTDFREGQEEGTEVAELEEGWGWREDDGSGEKRRRSARPTNLSVKEAKELTQRIIERIKKEGK